MCHYCYMDNEQTFFITYREPVQLKVSIITKLANPDVKLM